jgi:hypothetical protein
MRIHQLLLLMMMMKYKQAGLTGGMWVAPPYHMPWLSSSNRRPGICSSSSSSSRSRMQALAQ